MTPEKGTDVPVRWSHDHPPPKIANQALVAQSPTGEFFLYFGCITPPPITGPNDEQLKQVKDLAEKGITIHADPVIILSRKTADGLYKALGKQLGRKQ